MAHNVTCHTCKDELPAHEAVIRSVSLEQRAWHPECYRGEVRVLQGARPMGELGRRLAALKAS